MTELMNKREQELQKGDNWKELMRKENAPAVYPVEKDEDLKGHPELVDARRRGYMAMRVSQNYFCTLIAISLKSAKAQSSTPEGIQDNDARGQEGKTPNQPQTRSKAKQHTEDQVLQVGAMGLIKPEQLNITPPPNNETNVLTDNMEQEKRALKRKADDILPAPRKRKPPQYHKREIARALASFPSKRSNPTRETLGTWAAAPRPGDPGAHPNSVLAWAGKIGYSWPYKENYKRLSLVVPVRSVKDRGMNQISAV